MYSKNNIDEIIVIVFFDLENPQKYHGNYKKLDNFVHFLNENKRGWKYANVYEKKTRKFVQRVYEKMY